MNIRYFPIRNKRPLIPGWREQASADPAQLQAWMDQFGSDLTHWGVPMGQDTGILALDVDPKHNGFESLNRIDPNLPHSPAQRTPSGGAHIFFEYPPDGQRYGNSVDIKDGLDTRGEGGYCVIYGQGPDWTIPLAPAPGWVRARAHRIRTETTPESTIKIDPAIGQAMLLEAMETIRNAAPGESNNVLNVEAFKIGQVIAAGGLDIEFAKTQLLVAAQERGKPYREAVNTIESGIGGGHAHPLPSPFGKEPPRLNEATLAIINREAGVTERWTPRRLVREDLMNFSKLRKPQLFKDWSTVDIHITTADGGTGKSTLKLYEAVCLALAQPFLGFQCVNPGKTLFITGEDTAEKLAAMIGQILRQMGLFEPGHEAQVDKVLESIVIKKDSDLCLIIKDRHGFLQPSPDAFKKIMQAVEDIGPKMIVLDPIASFWGSESAVNDMAKAVAKFTGELVDRSGACVELINHMGKASSQGKDLSQFAGRGGTGLPSHSRVSRTMRNLDAEEFEELTGFVLDDKKSAILCQVNKFSDGSPLLMKPFVIMRDGFLFSRIGVTDAKVKEAESNQDDTERIMNFVREERAHKKYPTPDVVKAHFSNAGVPIALTRISRAIHLLQYSGLGGIKLKLIENPDESVGGKAFIVVDEHDREV